MIGVSGFTDTELVASTRHRFLIVQAAVTPTSVLPAPQGRTIIPERARPFENIFDRLCTSAGLFLKKTISDHADGDPPKRYKSSEGKHWKGADETRH